MCTLKIIPPKCTPWFQPCDLYIYVKHYVGKFQNFPGLTAASRKFPRITVPSTSLCKISNENRSTNSLLDKKAADGCVRWYGQNSLHFPNPMQTW